MRSEVHGNILLKKFTRFLNVSLPHDENKFRPDAMEIPSSRACRGIFSRFLRKSRESGAETTASSAAV